MLLNKRIAQMGGLVACLFFLLGCGGEQYTYEQENETKPGPGLLSGEDGEFTIFSLQKKKVESSTKESKTGTAVKP